MRLRENSQCSKILNRLKEQGGEGWVAMPELVTISGSYNIHSRVDELRHNHGVDIENHTDVSVVPHVSLYRLRKAVPVAPRPDSSQREELHATDPELAMQEARGLFNLAFAWLVFHGLVACIWTAEKFRAVRRWIFDVSHSSTRNRR